MMKNRPRRSRRKRETMETETERLKRVDGLEGEISQGCNPGEKRFEWFLKKHWKRCC